MKILVVHDRIDAVPADDKLPEDFGAEYEDENAVRGIIDALTRGGHSAEGLCLDESLVENIRRLRPDIVFNIAEGVRGRGRECLVPAWLDHLGVPYTGSDAAALGVSLDKAMTKHIANGVGIRTPRFRVVERAEELENIDLQYPLFLKPVAEGSSMGIRNSSLVNTSEELHTMGDWVISHYRQGCLVEEFAPGREYCVGIMGNREPGTLPIVEVRTSGDFYSYEQKSKHEKELVCPAAIPDELGRDMTAMALKMYSAIGCRDLARVDFKLDHRGKPAFLEINPLPGLAGRYGIFPHQARAGGMDYETLINHIVAIALERENIS